MPITITLQKQAGADVDALIVGAFSDRMDGDGVDLDWAFLAGIGFSGKLGESKALPGEHGPSRIVVGLGAADTLDASGLRIAAAVGARAARRHRAVATTLLDQIGDVVDARAAAQAIAEGVVVGSYVFTAYRAKAEPSCVERVDVVGTGGKRVQAAIDLGIAIGDAVCLARDLVNEPGGALTPRAFAHKAIELAETVGLHITVLDEVDVEAARLGGLMGVNRGSHEPPRFVELTWDPPTARNHVALVGKGITFDSGGLSIKPSDGMKAMKGDMAGAAAVLAAMSVLPLVAPRTKVTGYLPLTDNMPGPDAIRVGDVLRIRNGKTVEVLNTDAEGRLVLADGLAMASEQTPDAIIDIATLTGACMVALGGKTAGVMGNHDGLIDQLLTASDAAGEALWRLPISDEARKAIDSEVADLKNVSADRFGGALVAAAFLEQFVDDGLAWAHLDIAGPSWSDRPDSLAPSGGTGFGVRTLIEFVSHFSKPKLAR